MCRPDGPGPFGRREASRCEIADLFARRTRRKENLRVVGHALAANRVCILVTTKSVRRTLTGTRHQHVPPGPLKQGVYGNDQVSFKYSPTHHSRRCRNRGCRAAHRPDDAVGIPDLNRGGACSRVAASQALTIEARASWIIRVTLRNRNCRFTVRDRIHDSWSRRAAGPKSFPFTRRATGSADRERFRGGGQGRRWSARRRRRRAQRP